MINYIKKVFQDMIDQLWTLLGMFIAWVVLDGSAKTIVGYAIICTLIAWAVTYPIRNREVD
jgi:ABC-type multidrug transport system permease subunit